jgi:hypothetical protein
MRGFKIRRSRLSFVVDSLYKLYKVASQEHSWTGGPTQNLFSPFPVPLQDPESVPVRFLFLYSLFLFLFLFSERGHACHFFSTFFFVPVLDPESVRVPDPDPFPVLPFHVHPPVPDTDPFILLFLFLFLILFMSLFLVLFFFFILFVSCVEAP